MGMISHPPVYFQQVIQRRVGVGQPFHFPLEGANVNRGHPCEECSDLFQVGVTWLDDVVHQLFVGAIQELGRRLKIKMKECERCKVNQRRKVNQRHVDAKVKLFMDSHESPIAHKSRQSNKSELWFVLMCFNAGLVHTCALFCQHQ